ncbi:hypothetical protein [Rosenbergiella australiborealis]|uniref:Uncharacterized protein n=1 Tax=Rosenbergiella australiborealis TaxID=1544696 RepID=A0ABS5T5Z8_9GAMM|nr:hypothetical protein [Rosenbergiella australiborealis]MBT0726403.1 hypothetical protein [Rosenbergiella australiborealis]
MFKENDCISFNYSSLLSASCKKKWRFVDAIYGVLPIFGVVTRKSALNKLETAEYFKELALQIISTQVSDEMNIARLLVLAEQQNINYFTIQLPYSLSEHQIAIIYTEYRKPVNLYQENDFLHVTF